MGYFIHHTISVTSMNADVLAEARSFAIGIGAHVSELVPGQTNGVVSFTVAPDGSKEGWDESAAGDTRREAIKNWLRARAYADGSTHLKWFEVEHPEDGAPRVVDHQNKRQPKSKP
jgi:hypothetical protein